MNKFDFFHNRFFVFFVIITFSTTLFNGCYSFSETTVTDEPGLKIYKIETNKNELISFKKNKSGYGTISGDKIISIKVNGEEEIFYLSEVKKLYSEKFDYLNTSLIVVGVLGVIIFVSIALAPASILDEGMGGI